MRRKKVLLNEFVVCGEFLCGHGMQFRAIGVLLNEFGFYNRMHYQIVYLLLSK